MLTKLLKNAAILASKAAVSREAVLSRGEAFNIFDILGVTYSELSHSGFIASLLNPNGNHGQGPLFLDLFLQSVCASELDFLSRFKDGNIQVLTESVCPEGRIDILIKSGTDMGVIIENKIYAQDQHEQLIRYDRYSRKAFKNGFLILYLTPDGSDASPDSAKGVDYKRISYAVTILEWIEECKLKSIDKPLIRETLSQYSQILKSITSQNMDKKVEKEAIELMMKDPDATRFILENQLAWENFVVEKQVFEPLRAFAKEKNWQFGIEGFERQAPWGEFYFTVKENVFIVFQYEKTGWRDFYYGVVDKREGSNQIILLKNMTGGNKNWKHGWRYFDKYRTWDLNVVTSFAKEEPAELLQYIKQAVLDLFNELTELSII